MTWKIIRMEGADESGLECAGGTERPMKVSIRDDSTGAIETTIRCWDTNAANECVNFADLTHGGHTPNDWEGECPPE